MTRRDRFTWQHTPPHHCATCMRTCCHPSLSLPLSLHSRPRPRLRRPPRPLSCPSFRVQRSSNTGWPPSPACVLSQARTCASSPTSRRTSLRVCRFPSSRPRPSTPTPTRRLSHSTPTLFASASASTCSSAHSSASPHTPLSTTVACASSRCTSSSRTARSRAWSSTCRATSTTTCGTTTSATAAWTTPSKRRLPAAGTASWTCPTASCPSLCTLPCASTSASASRASCTSSPPCLLA